MKGVDFIKVEAIYGRGLVLRDIPLAALSNFWLLFVLSTYPWHRRAAFGQFLVLSFKMNFLHPELNGSF